MYTVVITGCNLIFAFFRLNGLIASGAGDDCIRIFTESESQDTVQEGSQSYELVQKHEKAHSADINCVQWHPKVS